MATFGTKARGRPLQCEDFMPTGERLRAMGILVVAMILGLTAALIAAVEAIARRSRDRRP